MFARISIGAPALTLDALSFAIDALRTERDRSKKQGNMPGEERAGAMRDVLGSLYQSIALAQLRDMSPPPRSGKRWTPGEDNLLRACWGSARRTTGCTDEALQQLADAVGRTPVAVALRLQLLDIWHQ